MQLVLLGTEDIMVSLIQKGILTVEQADSIKLDWKTNHRFKLRFSTFAKRLLPFPYGASALKLWVRTRPDCNEWPLAPGSEPRTPLISYCDILHAYRLTVLVTQMTSCFSVQKRAAQYFD